jgi:hypothetical protein
MTILQTLEGLRALPNLLDIVAKARSFPEVEDGVLHIMDYCHLTEDYELSALGEAIQKAFL